MAKTVSILGNTPKEQWLNAIAIYEACLINNAFLVDDEMCGLCERDCGDCKAKQSIGIVIGQTRKFADEMRRLVEGVM